MIDTIIIKIYRSREEVTRRMKSQVTKSYEGKEITFRKEQLKLIGGNITKINFSLSKFVNGNNYENVPFDKIKLGVDAFVELLNIPYEELLLSRIDIACSFNMEHSVHNYLSKFEMLDRFDKTIYNNGTIKYCNKNITLSFYDKLLEMRQHRKTVPTISNITKKEILRYELQVRGNIKKVINYDSSEQLNICAIQDDNFLELLVDAWLFNFQKVMKTRTIDSPFLPPTNFIKSPKDFNIFLQHQGAKTIGAKKIKPFLKNEVKDAVTRSRIRTSLIKSKEYVSTFETSKTKNDMIRLEIKGKAAYYKMLGNICP
ncbi:MAG: hypothetical protein A2499_10810 [Stygiobacter sp. RIFOXYC12_FULL_38_8]|nr:MAG: hypothetical protein A2279_12335 [Stygiobacter sp. RIFOXYA12_FULL_38_9]OGV06507.1 MAG: hypothetical protein A2299_02270 [Stygiobacter sp. RIFOXYB2_FULL_37_11]OGV10552.1 MAG: hypothetical protein A2237_18625 [Stygiobacter sp. RIFOXYA2_FULL_38_8]OGV13232.1 MAG: hypothetical protein A2440_12950 [Stygiobacter sp. RIFOXYC2_FULL_38_25]OGV23063.1 MAG: hypothetical protein A2499_10810 [Stygiobacter sp. RIFOXYC12_FULL_38_8]OGV83278.1 MAG: hypothetical protein A2X65_16505 [Stygiobacter sp. GWF2_